MKSARRNINHKAVFKRRTKKDDNDALSNDLIISARKSGQLNLSGKGLYTVPERIWCINEYTEEELREICVDMNITMEKDRWWEQETLKHLDLSSNSITTIDPKISGLSDLHSLYLNNNLIKTLPESFGNLNNLKELNLSCNKLENLGPSFYKLIELIRLNLNHNCLQTLHVAIGDLIMLEILDLSHNNLHNLPVGLGYLVRMKSLNLSHNQIKTVPPDIASMRALKTLDISFNLVENLPPLGELRKVEKFNFQSNNIKCFPDLTGCTSLRELHLSNNNIQEIDATNLISLGQLKVLTMKDNKLENIPEEIIQLINLEQFDLSCNKLTKLPHSIASMPNLRNLNIEGNDSLKIRRDILHSGTWRILQHLRENVESSNTESHESSLIGETIHDSPDKYTMRNSKLLSLVGRNISKISETVLQNAKEAEVTCIDLSKNKLCDVQEGISKITSVMDLKLSCNELKCLPEWIGECLIHLRFIDLSRNILSSLPISIGYLNHLIEINLSFNRFSELPECLSSITGLQIIIANNNQISGINMTLLKNIKSLITLDLSNNNISYVPPELGNMRNIRTLALHGNCFKQPRQATLMKSTDEIMAYLRDRIPASGEVS